MNHDNNNKFRFFFKFIMIFHSYTQLCIQFHLYNKDYYYSKKKKLQRKPCVRIKSLLDIQTISFKTEQGRRFQNSFTRRVRFGLGLNSTLLL